MQVAIGGVLVDGSTPVTSTPSRQNWNAPQGADVTITLTVVGSSGAAVNLTGYANPLLTIRNAPSAGPQTAQNVFAPLVGTITSPSTGVVQFTLPGSSTKGLYSSYVYDVFVTNASSKRDEVVPPSFCYFTPAPGA